LATAISINPHKIGVGIDENTALHIIDGEVGNIYGANSVTILDGREIEYSGHEDGIAKDPIALTNMKFHSLPEGWKYNFKSFLPSKATTIDENILNYEIKEIS
jgi:cyanophycinase